MTCHDVTITSQTRHFDSEAAILNPKLTMTSPKIYEFVLTNILSQNKHTKVKNYLLLTNEGGKTEKRLKKTENSQNTLLSKRLLWKRQSS